MEGRRAPAAIATGFAALDSALGVGGLPRGRMVEIFGPPSCGKTTLVLQIVATAQQKGAMAAWIDAEHVFDPTFWGSLGVSLDRLTVAQPTAAEEALEIARRLTVSGALDMVVIDSAAALVPELELRAGIGDNSPGLQGRVLASGLRRLSLAVAKTDTAVVFLNHSYARGESGGSESESSAGGAPLKLYAAVRIALGSDARGGLTFRVLKNRVGEAFGEGRLTRAEGGGFVKTP